MAELVRLGLGAEVDAGLRERVPRGDRRRSVPRPGARPGDRRGGHRADGGGRPPASRRLAPRAVSQSVVLAAERASPQPPRELARAAAVLGEADLRLAAGLADVDPGTAATAADELAAAGILEEGRPAALRAPDRAGGGRGGSLARRAGRPACGGGAAPRGRGRVCAIGSQPTCWRPTRPGDDWVVESLRAAARAAVANGAPDSAVAYLRRALAEPPSERLRPDVLLELGFAESYAGDPQAAAHLEAALDTAARRDRSGLDHARARTHAPDRGAQPRGAGGVRPHTRAAFASPDRRAALTLEGAALGAAQLDADDRGRRRSADRPPPPAGRGTSPTFPRASSARWRSRP